MGRYFPFRIHPFSIAECVRTDLPKNKINAPRPIDPEQFNALWEFGGYPDPFLKQDKRFLTRWRQLRYEQLFRGDIRDLSQIQEIDQLEILAKLLKEQIGQLINFSNLAK